MCTNVNHNYGIPIDGVPPLLAVPLAGIVQITVKNSNGDVVGETTANQQGEWQQTFCLDDGNYTVTVSGVFRPIGEGFKSIYNRLVPSLSIGIKVPLIPDEITDPDEIGSTGPQGSPGESGQTGVAGLTGPQGPDGEAGSIGPEGPDGFKGSPGDRGSQGPLGPQGPQGSQGVRGSQGPAGAGPVGATGPQGSSGSSGAVGATGATGPQGADGSDGAVGATGTTGPQGPQGTTGDTGAIGETGPQGTVGETGPAASDHSSLSNLDVDDHTQYALLAGRSGQTLIGGTASEEDLTLLSTSDGTKGTVFITDDPTEKVQIGSDAGTGGNTKVRISSTQDAYGPGDTVDVSEIHLLLHNILGANSAGPGLGFSNDATNSLDTGAAIVHERTGGNSRGKLHFATKESQLSAVDIPIRMTIDETGNVGIGTPDPDYMLHIQGTTGASLFLDGETGVDGIIFPDRTIQTTAASGIGGATGATGPQGPAGSDGSDGSDGAIGETGVTGPQGPQGTAGDTGTQGVTGATGPPGPAGSDGGGTGDHGFLDGLGDDDHTQYALLAGRSGGQILIGGTASGEDLVLESTENGTKGTIFLGVAVDNDRVEIRSDLDAHAGLSTIDISELALGIHNYTNINRNASGLGFAVSAIATNIGAAIIHERVDTNSQGKLHFATKTGPGTATNIPIHMTIDHQGFVGIGSTGPTEVLHVVGGNVFVDGETGVDGIMFPDRTIQTTAATGSGGGSDTLAVFTPQHFTGPNDNAARININNDHPVLDFEGGGSTGILADFEHIVPQHYANGDIDVHIHYALDGTQSGNIVWKIEVERQIDGTFDIDVDGFATGQTVTATPASDGVTDVATIILTNAEADSIATGDGWRIRLTRDLANASDTENDTAEFLKMEIRNG